MSTPGPLQAVADLRRCLRDQDHAGAERLIGLPATLAGLDELTGQALTACLEADKAWREAAAVQRAEAERALVQARIGPLLEELIGVLAGALAEQEHERKQAAWRYEADLRSPSPAAETGGAAA